MAQADPKGQYRQLRMKVALWFQQNKYRKEVRSIRAEWLEFIKS